VSGVINRIDPRDVHCDALQTSRLASKYVLVPNRCVIKCSGVQFVHGELLRISGQCVPADVARFPALQERLVDAVESFINDGAVRMTTAGPIPVAWTR
jgi:hypothetical protein